MSEKIKVVHILPSLVRAGAERVARDLLLSLDKEKFSVSLILFKDNGSGADWKQELEARGVKVIALKKRCLIDVWNFWQLFQAAKRLRPDIVHTHLGGDIYGRLAGRLAGVRIIVSTEHNLNLRERSSAAWLKKQTARFATKIFAVSQAVKADAMKRYQLPREKLEVVYNGVDLKTFKVTGANSRNDVKNIERELVIGSLGRLNEQKGFSVLIKAISQTQNKNYQVKIAGTGELEADLKNLITNLRLDSRVKLVGLAEPVSFINSLDIVVVPSLWEGLGLVALEAAALKKPIIASAVDGLQEIINQENGFLFPVDDATALAEKIDYVINNFSSSEINNKTAIARKTIEDKFSLEVMTSSYSDWYERLLIIPDLEEKMRGK